MPMIEHSRERAELSRYFVGRSAEIERFRALLSSFLADTGPIDDSAGKLTASQPSIIRISGHSGLGKSQLLQQFALMARQTQRQGRCRTIPIIDWREGNRFPEIQRHQIMVEDVLDLVQRRLHAADLVPLRSWAEPEAVASRRIGTIRDNTGQISVGDYTQLYQFNNSIVTVHPVAEDLQARAHRQHTQREAMRDALCADLRRLSQEQPLILFFDGYELIDSVDRELQPLFRYSGRRVLWVIAGRRSLAGVTNGYNSLDSDHPAIEMPLAALSVAEVASLVEQHGQALDSHQIVRLQHQTRGIPWILNLALNMLKQAQAHASVLSANIDAWLQICPTVDSTIPDHAIVDQMVERLLYPCASEDDRRDLFALALVRKPLPAILEHLLETERLRGRLQQLADRYEFVNPNTRTIDNTVADFFRRKLLHIDDTDMPLINRLSERARHYCLSQLRSYPPERHADQLMDDDQSAQRASWSDMLLEYLHHTLRVAPEQGVAEVVAAFCCATLYNPGLRLPLLASIEDVEVYLSTALTRMLKALPQAAFWSYSDHDVKALLRLVEQLQHMPVVWHPQPDQAWNEARAAVYTLRAMIYDPGTRRHDETQGQDVHTAISLYERALHYHDTAVILNARLGQAYSHKSIQRYHNAAQASLRAATLEWDERRKAIYYNNAGAAYFQAKQLARAQACYEQAVRLNSMDAVAHFNYGLVHHRLGNTQQALAMYNKALQIDSTLASVYEYRGLIQHELERYEEALNDYRMALQSATASAYVYVYRAHTYRTLGYYQQALADYNQALQMEPNASPHYALRAMCYAYLGQFQAALADLEQATEHMQKNELDVEDWIVFSKAVVYSLWQQPDLALKHLQRALELDRKRSLHDIQTHRAAFAQLSADNPQFAAVFNLLIAAPC